MLDIPNDIPTVSSQWLAHSLLAGGVLLSIGALLMLSTRQPARRQRLGELALASSLLVAGLCALPGWQLFSVPCWPPATSPPAAVEWENHDGTAAREPRIDLSVEVQAGRLLWFQFATEEDEETAAEGLTAPVFVPLEDGRPPGFGAWLAAGFPWFAALYGCVAGGLFVRCLLGYLALWRLVQASQPPPASAAAMFTDLTRHWRRPPRFRVADRLDLPISFGLWRPTVLVPPSFCRPSDLPALRVVLIHELTHLERCDAWSCLLVALSQAVYFFLPWFYWLRRQVRLCQEYVADATAAAATSSEDYAQYLVSLAPRPTPAAALVSGVGETSSDLFRRISMLLNASERVDRNCPRWWSYTAAAGFLAVAVLVSGIRLQADAAPPADADDETVLVEVQDPQGGTDKDDAKLTQAVQGVYRLRLLQALQQEKAQKHALTELDKLQVQLKALSALEKLAVVQKERKEKDKGKETDQETGEARKQLEQARDQLEAARAQAEAQVKMAEAQLKAVRAAMERVQKQAVEAAKSAADQEAAAKYDAAKAKAVLHGKLFDRAVKLPDNVVLRYNTGGRLGIRIESPSPILVEQLNLPKNEGVVIVEVFPESAAAKVGFQANDILLTFNDQPVSHQPEEFAKTVKEMKADAKFTATVLRKGKKTTLKGLLGEAAQPNPQPTIKARIVERGELKLQPVVPLEVRVEKGSKAEAGQPVTVRVHTDGKDEKKQAGQVMHVRVHAEGKDVKAGQPLSVLIDKDGKHAVAGLKADKDGKQTVIAVIVDKDGKHTVLGEKELRVLMDKDGKHVLGGLHLDKDGKHAAAAVIVDKDGKHAILGDKEVRVVIDKDGKHASTADGKAVIVKKAAGGDDTQSVTTTTIRQNERFTTRHQEGSLIISVSGTVDDGKVKTSEIVVQDGGVEHKYESVKAVPERYRDKVKNLVEMNEKGQIRIELRK